jgi:hypothetical protein
MPNSPSSLLLESTRAVMLKNGVDSTDPLLRIIRITPVRSRANSRSSPALLMPIRSLRPVANVTRSSSSGVPPVSAVKPGEIAKAQEIRDARIVRTFALHWLYSFQRLEA